MTEDEIMALANEYADVRFDKKGRNKQYEFDNLGIISFAQRIESRTSLTDSGWWFEEGARLEREACANMVEQYCGAWDDQGQALAQMIRARGERDE